MAAEPTRILYLSYDGLTDPLGGSQILPYLCGLSEEGYQITLVSFEKPNRFKLHEDEVLTICKNYGIKWVPLNYHKSPPVLSTLYDLFVLKLVVKKLLLGERFAIVHCRSYVTAFIGLWARKRLGVRFIFDMRGFWVDERVEGGIWKLDNPVYRLIFKFFKSKEKDFIRNCDYIISLTENGKREVLSWDLGDKPIAVIPTCVDMKLFDPGKITTETADVRRRLSIDPDQFVLVYIGSWGTWYLTDEMLKFFSVLSSIRRKSTLLIITPDEPDLSEYQFLSQIIVRSAKRREVPLYLNIADAAICFIKPSYSKRASSATKVAEAWAMNLPVVTNSGWGDIDRLKHSGMPLFLCDSDEDYHEVAQSLLLGNIRGNRDMLIGKFDLSSGIQHYGSIYRSLKLI